MLRLRGCGDQGAGTWPLPAVAARTLAMVCAWYCTHRGGVSCSAPAQHRIPTPPGTHAGFDGDLMAAVREVEASAAHPGAVELLEPLHGLRHRADCEWGAPHRSERSYPRPREVTGHCHRISVKSPTHMQTAHGALPAAPPGIQPVCPGRHRAKGGGARGPGHPAEARRAGSPARPWLEASRGRGLTGAHDLGAHPVRAVARSLLLPSHVGCCVVFGETGARSRSSRWTCVPRVGSISS